MLRETRLVFSSSELRKSLACALDVAFRLVVVAAYGLVLALLLGLRPAHLANLLRRG